MQDEDAPAPQSDQIPTDSSGGLSDRMLGNLKAALTSFRVAMSNFTLFPSDSPQVRKATSAAYTQLANILTRIDTITISEIDGQFLINGKDPKFTGKDRKLNDYMLDLMKSSNIRNANFQHGMSQDELWFFMDCLHKKIWTTTAAQEIKELFKQHDINHIGVDELVYVAMAEKDVLLHDQSSFFDRGENLVDSIMDTIEHLVETIETVESIQSRDKLRRHIFETLFNHNPELFSEIYREKASGPDHAVTTDSDTAITVDEPFVRDILGDLAKAIELIHVSAASPQDELQSLVTRAAKKLISILQGGGVQSKLFEEFFTRGASAYLDASPCTARESDPLLSQTQELLTMEATAMVRQYSVNQLDDLLSNLKSDGHHELLVQVSDKLLDGLDTKVAELREKCVHLLAGVLTTLECSMSREELKSLDVKCLQCQENEQNAGIYEDISSILVNRTVALLREQDYGGIEQIITLFRRHFQQKKQPCAERSVLALKALDHLSRSDLFYVLTGELGHANTQRRQSAANLLEGMNEAAVSPLIKEITKMEDLDIRYRMASIIKRIGPDATIRMAKEIQREGDPVSIKRILSVFSEIPDDKIVLREIRKLMPNASHDLRDDLLKIFLARDPKESSKAIAALLRQEKEDAARLQYIEALARLGLPEAAGILSGLITTGTVFEHGESPEIQMAACRALGHTKCTLAMETLLDVLDPPSLKKGLKESLTSLFANKNKEIQIAAAEALGAYRDKRIVQDALRSMLDHKDPEIRESIAHALYGESKQLFNAQDAPMEKAADAPRDRHTGTDDMTHVCCDTEFVMASGIIHGDIHLFPVNHLIEIIAMQERSGSLMIDNGKNVGKILFRNGDITRAELADMTGRQAIDLMATWENGQFFFDENETDNHLAAASYTPS